MKWHMGHLFLLKQPGGLSGFDIKIGTLPETNKTPEKIDPWKFGDSELGNHHFWGQK